jgi:hypothetical protein
LAAAFQPEISLNAAAAKMNGIRALTAARSIKIGCDEPDIRRRPKAGLVLIDRTTVSA